ncbi:Bifunctional ligase/repressor BirA [Paraliobacillus sp. PM-2]|uniref:biotin--[acetyl-CoA-carboxylase] ligase n=1 Tax=Paraliobacillus sp. PM-2 TaxID=1462524 RepID=UPI00061CC858|nr:biotin--[acetyl-CoA-carboxylase] ligase [Paraliobacillus sp. PM-2]CQR46672.1 Bifunctional ligase/repressor BirA [Paraliobacillus sp. PM-2]
MASTRDRIIALLSDHCNSYLSGQAISDQLNISRTAVWKQMKVLKQDGYLIEAIPNKGYRILSTPDKLSENTLRWGLETNWLGKSIYFHEKIDSTQTKANQLAQSGCEHGTVVLADRQEAGRGRMNRTWYSDHNDGIWMSIVLRPTVLPSQAAQFTLLMGTVLADVLTEKTGLSIKIKWPNDLFINDKKIAGILTEMQAEQDQIHYLVIGIGINVNQTTQQFDTAIRQKATSLREAAAQSFSKRDLIQSILHAFEIQYEQYNETGFSEIKKRWEKRGYKMNQHVTYQSGNTRSEGIIRGIGQDGALLLQDKDGEVHSLYSAEIDW